MNKVIVCGIDVGLKGGISFHSVDNSTVNFIEVLTMPLKSKLIDYIKLAELISKADYVFVERQFVMHSQGLVSSGTTMENFGIVKGICYGLDKKLTVVASKDWQQFYKGETAEIDSKLNNRDIKDTKKRSISLCKKYYPNTSLLASSRCKNESDGMSDSVLISRYGAYLLLTENML